LPAPSLLDGGIYRKPDFAGGLSSDRGNISWLTGVCSGVSRRQHLHWGVLAILLVASVLSLRPTVNGASQPMRVTFVSVEHRPFGSVIRFEIRNAGNRSLYFPQSPYWQPGSTEPAIQSLDIEQWSDGKTNMLERGRSLSASLAVKPGFYSVGPCHDVPWDHKWVVLKAGQVYSGQIAAFEPGDSYIPTSCSWHHAHLGGLIRLEVNAYPSKASMRRIKGVSDSMELVRTATSSMLGPPSN
jgi:hypothetical protein